MQGIAIRLARALAITLTWGLVALIGIAALPYLLALWARSLRPHLEPRAR